MFAIYKIDAWSGAPNISPVARAHAVLLFTCDTIAEAERKLNRHKDAFPGDYFLGLGQRVDGDGHIHIPRPDANGHMAFSQEALART